MAYIQEVPSLYLSHNTYNPDWDISRSSSVPPSMQISHVTINQAISVSFHISHNSLFIYYQSVIQHYKVRFVNQIFRQRLIY